MGFRDEQLAGRERVDALEKEVARLHAENEALKAPAPRPKSREPKLGKFIAPVAGVALLAVIGAAVAPLPPAGRMVLVSIAVIAMALGVLLSVVSRSLLVVEPGELLVLSGRRHIGADGTTRGYRIVRGGRVLRIPIIESAERMALGPFPLELEVGRAYARGNRVVRLRASAAVELASEPQHLPNAVERFLGRSPDDIVEVTRQTLEGALRAVVAELTLEQLQQETPRATEACLAEVEYDLQKLGLSLASFVVDDVAAV